MAYFENIKSKDKSVLNNASNKNNPSNGDYPEPVVFESSAKPSLGHQFGSPSLVWQKIHYFIPVVL